MSSTQQPIVSAHNLDEQSKKEIFKSFISNQRTSLPQVGAATAEDRGVFIIEEKNGPKYLAYFNSQYCGPYKWDELPDLFKDDKELCDLFFTSLADEHMGLGYYKGRCWQGMWVLLRYASLDKYTLRALRELSLDEVNIYLLPILLKKPTVGVDQGLLEHAFQNTLVLLLGQEPSGEEPGIPGLIMHKTSRMPEIAQCYYLLSTASRDKMKLMCAHFTKQLRELEETILGILADDEMVSYRFASNNLQLIVQADIYRLLQNRHTPSSVKALSGSSDLLLERWAKQALNSLGYDIGGRAFKLLETSFELYYNLRTLPTSKKELLLSRNEQLFTELEEYVLACICNPRIPGSLTSCCIEARDREIQLSVAGNTTLLNEENNWLRAKVLGKIDGIPDAAQTSYETSLDTITSKYLDSRCEPAISKMAGVAEADGDKNIHLHHGVPITRDSSDVSSPPVRGGFIKAEGSVPSPITNQGPAVKSDQLDTRESLGASSGIVGGPTNTDNQVDNQIPGSPTAAKPVSPANTKNPTSPSILQISFVLALVVISVVVVRYFMYGRSLSNALGIRHTSAARGLSG